MIEVGDENNDTRYFGAEKLLLAFSAEFETGLYYNVLCDSLISAVASLLQRIFHF